MLPKPQKYFPVQAVFKNVHNSHANKELKIYVPYSKFRSKEKFYPIDSTGNEIQEIECEFDGQGCCKLELKVRGGHWNEQYKPLKFKPNILFHKGDKKSDVNERLIHSLTQSISDIRKQLIDTQKQVEKKYEKYQQYLQSPFVAQADIDVAISGILDQIDKLNLRIKDCERLESLCR